MKIQLPAIGDQVRLIFTGDTGEVTRIIDRETVGVRIGGDVIPVFAEHLEITASKALDAARLKAAKANEKNTVIAPKPQNIPPKRVTKAELAERLKATGLHAAPDNLPDKGLRFVMQPFHHPDGLIDYFLLHLINDTGKPIRFSYRMFLDTHEYEAFVLQQVIGGRETCILNSLAYDDMNENPEMQFDFDVLSLHEEDVNVVPRFERDVKPKAKILRHPPQEVARIDGRGYVFDLCASLPRLQPTAPPPPEAQPLLATDLKKAADKLKAYDQTHGKQETHQSKVEINAHLRTVDLHIEKLLPSHKHLSNTDIIHIQLAHFKKELEEAIRRHEKSMIVIHGLGKGKLKQEVFKLLLEYREVKNFANEYDPRFGFGATLIDLE